MFHLIETKLFFLYVLGFLTNDFGIVVTALNILVHQNRDLLLWYFDDCFLNENKVINRCGIVYRNEFSIDDRSLMFFYNAFSVVRKNYFDKFVIKTILQSSIVTIFLNKKNWLKYNWINSHICFCNHYKLTTNIKPALNSTWISNFTDSINRSSSHYSLLNFNTN